MSPETLDAILDKIDAAVGPPESETPEERAERKRRIERHAREREIRKDHAA